MKPYIHPHVQLVQEFQKDVLDQRQDFDSVSDFLIEYAKKLQMGFVSKHKAASIDISNYYKPLIGKSEDEIFSSQLLQNKFLDIAASVHGFRNIDLVPKDAPINHNFEKALDLLLVGDTKALKSLLEDFPELINLHSSYGHQAQLIHYCASNAVEIYRQMVPGNIIDIIKLLIGFGADPATKIPVYGGDFDFMALFDSSSHPREAKVYQEVVTYFKSN